MSHKYVSVSRVHINTPKLVYTYKFFKWSICFLIFIFVSDLKAEQYLASYNNFHN